MRSMKMICGMLLCVLSLSVCTNATHAQLSQPCGDIYNEWLFTYGLLQDALAERDTLFTQRNNLQDEINDLNILLPAAEWSVTFWYTGWQDALNGIPYTHTQAQIDSAYSQYVQAVAERDALLADIAGLQALLNMVEMEIDQIDMLISAYADILEDLQSQWTWTGCAAAYGTLP